MNDKSEARIFAESVYEQTMGQMTGKEHERIIREAIENPIPEINSAQKEKNGSAVKPL